MVSLELGSTWRSSAVQGVGWTLGSAGWLGDCDTEAEAEAEAEAGALLAWLNAVAELEAGVLLGVVTADALLLGVDAGVDAGAEELGEPLGVPSAKAAGADSRARGAMTAVAAAAAMARRSFMKTSGSPGVLRRRSTNGG
ncbi:hypothetical protein [Streptomyces sp. NPDC046197]|uniref:hypothetical protein n=1 Tax=Streptomyces sp. NPDC046197 TaxID=3154337 RepID=UPI00340E66BE